MSDVGSVAEAVTALSNLFLKVLDKSQLDLIDDEFHKAVSDVQKFKDLLGGVINSKRESGNPDEDCKKYTDACARVQLALDGLMCVVPVDVSASDYQRLRETDVGKDFDYYDLLGLYAASRGASYYARVLAIVQSQIASNK